LRDYTFVDFGAGKGRTLLLASHDGFRKIIGVEFAGELVKCATDNIAHYKNAAQKCRDIQVIEADAVEFALPHGPLVIYFYNPFTREVLDFVMRNIVRSLKADRRNCYIIYGSSSADAIDWAAPAILATGCFTQVSTPPMPFFFDAVRTICFGVFRLH
jgi:SAM-dependent methyltransferase